jgi:hypothetical protein
MKKLMIGAASFVIATSALFAVDALDVRIPPHARWEKTVEFSNSVEAELNAATTALTTAAKFIVSTGTNVAATTVTPLGAGTFLIAANKVVVGSATGTVAVSTGATTNDWVLVGIDQ